MLLRLNKKMDTSIVSIKSQIFAFSSCHIPQLHSGCVLADGLLLGHEVDSNRILVESFMKRIFCFSGDEGSLANVDFPWEHHSDLYGNALHLNNDFWGIEK